MTSREEVTEGARRVIDYIGSEKFDAKDTRKSRKRNRKALKQLIRKGYVKNPPEGFDAYLKYLGDIEIAQIEALELLRWERINKLALVASIIASACAVASLAISLVVLLVQLGFFG